MRTGVIFKEQQDSFSATGTGTVVDARTVPLSSFALQVAPVGNVTSWDVRLEGSLDNALFTTLLTHTNLSPGSGQIVVTGAVLAPFLYFRTRCKSVDLGSGIRLQTHVVGKDA